MWSSVQGVNVIEIKEPDLNATLVAESIAEQLSKRASFRRTMKQYCELAMNAGAKGVKIICAGRLAGSEMARRETQKRLTQARYFGHQTPRR